MKSTTTNRLRRGSLEIITTALILTTAPTLSYAQNLRRSSSSSIRETTDDMIYDVDIDNSSGSVSYSKLIEGDNFGFHAVSSPMDYESMNSTLYYDRFRKHHRLLQEETNEMEEDDVVEPKEYINDETLTFVESEPEDIHQRDLQSCASNEMLWTFKLRTDQYGYETSWRLDKVLDNKSLQLITSGPPPPSKYADNTIYQGAVCLRGDQMYKLTVEDSNNDGLCCNYGSGYYTYSVDGFVEYDSRGQGKTFTDEKNHQFYVGLPPPANNGNLSNNGDPGPFSGRTEANCSGDQQRITIEIMTDRYGGDNNWNLKSPSGQILRSGGGYANGAPRTDSTSICVSPGTYKFTLNDNTGDGICCKEGEGYYKLYMDGEMMVLGNDFNFGTQIKHDIIVGYASQLTNLSDREIQYLNCHNWRRQKYHEQYGYTYVPLKYDLSLQRDAQSWANALLDDCKVDGIKHEPGVLQGENLAKNMGTDDWGQLYSVENICRRWFEREEDWSWPDNAHFTQGIWRSGRYMGCAESEKDMGGGAMCRIQVCRYARAGNCAMGQYDSHIGDNWKIPTFQMKNPCGPRTPPNGAH